MWCRRGRRSFTQSPFHPQHLCLALSCDTYGRVSYCRGWCHIHYFRSSPAQHAAVSKYIDPYLRPHAPRVSTPWATRRAGGQMRGANESRRFFPYLGRQTCSVNSFIGWLSLLDHHRVCCSPSCQSPSSSVRNTHNYSRARISGKSYRISAVSRRSKPGSLRFGCGGNPATVYAKVA